MNTLCATCPLPWMLSQDMTVNGGMPRSRRRTSASVISPKVVRRHRARHQIGLHRRIVGVELAGDRVEVVAALGDRQRDDPGGRVGHLLDHRLRVVRREQVLARSSRSPAAPSVPSASLSTSVYRQSCASMTSLHPGVERHHADPADPPVQRLALVHQPVQVHRLVGSVEAADPEVHDAGGDRRAVVARAPAPTADPRVAAAWFERQSR